MNLSLDKILIEGRALAKYSRDKLQTVSQLRVSTPYLIVSATSFADNTLVIKLSAFSKRALRLSPRIKYALIDNTKQVIFRDRLPATVKLVAVKDIEIDNLTVAEDFYELSLPYSPSFLVMDKPLAFKVSSFLIRRNDINAKVLCHLNEEGEILLQLVIIKDDGELVRLEECRVLNYPFNIQSAVDFSVYTNWHNFKQLRFIDELLVSDCAHMCVEWFMNELHMKVPKRIIEAGAHQKHTILFYLIKIIGKTAVQKLFAKSNFTIEELDKLIPQNVPSLSAFKITEK